MLAEQLPPSQNLSPDSILSAFVTAITQKGLSLYPAQEEAILEIMSGKHVILSTPTGSGKSLVALAMHFKAMAEGKRSYYTCPIKALVSEKFFALCAEFGAHSVGMLTGDASINHDAPIICCTAEVLANMAMAEQESAPIEYVIMDEFHYYADPDRGAAWQIPLITLPQTTFLLMSATLGNTEKIETSLQDFTHKEVVRVHTNDRPVPLHFEYVETPLHETLQSLIGSNRYPVYVVNFTQREAVEEAQSVTSVNFCTKDEKKLIADNLEGLKFDSPFGKDIKRFVAHGIGLHHAGLLPKYRLLVEKLAQAGLLKVVMGTDTLGVGVNVPIRTVLFTKLSKYNGIKVSHLLVRDFKQISGRAGRKGFDDEGFVVCEAPEHVIENKRAENRFSANDKQKRKVIKKAPPQGFVAWDEKTFQRLINGEPEALQSRMALTHGMILDSLQRDKNNPQDGYKRLVQIIARSHENDRGQSRLRKQAASLFKSLASAKLIRVSKRQVIVDADLQQDFALFHTLSLYLIDAIAALEPNHPEYALDVLSLLESVLESPRVILQKQVDKAKSAKMAEMRAEGLEYEERMAELEKVEHPKPLAEFIYETFRLFREKHPWAADENILPKSIAREMYERLATFNQYVSEYELQRSEGIVLRYLSQTYRTLMQNIPDYFKTEGVWEIIAYLRFVLAKTDTSLIQEWEQMKLPSAQTDTEFVSKTRIAPLDDNVVKAHIRGNLQALLKAWSSGNYEMASQCVSQTDQPQIQFEQLWDVFASDHDFLKPLPQMALAEYRSITKADGGKWRVRQVLCDTHDFNDWVLEGTVQVAENNDIGDIELTHFGPA